MRIKFVFNTRITNIFDHVSLVSRLLPKDTNSPKSPQSSYVKEIDRYLFPLGWHDEDGKSNFRLNVAVFLHTTAQRVSSRVESRQVEPTPAAIQEERVKEKREESSFSPFPSQSGVSDSRSAASTPTVGTLTLKYWFAGSGKRGC